MIRETFEQYEIIEEASGHAFQEELNRAMRIHKEQNPFACEWLYEKIEKEEVNI